MSPISAVLHRRKKSLSQSGETTRKRTGPSCGSGKGVSRGSTALQGIILFSFQFLIAFLNVLELVNNEKIAFIIGESFCL
jgi:hypothetical protein